MIFQCPQCGLRANVNMYPVHCLCGLTTYAEQVDPSFLDKTVNFTKAMIQDISTGMQRCTKEEIDQRLSICKECHLYKVISENKGTCLHKSCGCNVSNEQVFLNKLHWKSQSCPLKKW